MLSSLRVAGHRGVNSDRSKGRWVPHPSETALALATAESCSFSCYNGECTPTKFRITTPFT